MTALVKADTTFNRQIEAINSIQGDNYGYHVRDFTRWAGAMDYSRIEPQTVIDYFSHLNKTSYSANTIRIKRQAVKKRLRQLSYMGSLDHNFRDGLESFMRDLDRETQTKAPKINTKHVDGDRYLTRDEIKTLLASSKGERQNTIIRFLWSTGCRVSEMTGIRLSDCKTIGDTVHIRLVGKGNKERYVKISVKQYNDINRVMRGVQHLFETSTGKPYHRSAVSDQLAKLTKRVLGKTCRAHAFRHSFATSKIKTGIPISYVSKYLGHSSLSITSDMYDHGAIDTADLVADEL